MAEPDSILQLGIEAAREGNKEEARNLFRLLSRQEPNNAQAWLWLAGVAENREERQAALERVLDLEPDNEMALKGLQALGAEPVQRGMPPPPVIVSPGPPTSRAVPADDPFADDDPFAELDALSETMAADTSGPVRRADAIGVGEANADDLASRSAAAASVGSAVAASRAEADARSAANRASASARRASRYDDDEEPEPPRRGISPLLGVLLFLVALGLIGLLIAYLFPGIFGGGNQVANNPAAQTAAVAGTTAAGGLPEGVSSPVPGSEGTVDPNAPVAQPTVDPNAPVAQPTVDPNAPAVDPNAPVAQPTVDPNTPAVNTGAQPVDVSQANPAIVQANTPLSSEGWLYDFNQPTFAASIIGNLGQFTPNNGRFVVVLAYVVNNTGQPQAIPGSFFVLKDAQGRVWEARPEVSTAYVVPGQNADLTQTQEIPPDGLTRSVAIIFDVAPDATDLVFFARPNPTQGWIVLRSV